jgi:hypothetical protein
MNEGVMKNDRNIVFVTEYETRDGVRNKKTRSLIIHVMISPAMNSCGERNSIRWSEENKELYFVCSHDFHVNAPVELERRQLPRQLISELNKTFMNIIELEIIIIIIIVQL